MTIASARSALTALLTTLAVGAPHVVIAAEAPPAPWTVVHAGLLLAAPPQPPKSRQSLLIRGDRIVEIRDGFVDPATLQVAGQPAPRRVDLSDRFVLPGLLGVGVVTTDLEIAAASYERQISELVEADPDTAAYVQSLEEREAEEGHDPDDLVAEVERFLRENPD